MRLRYGIPFTLALLAASSWISDPGGINAYYILIAGTALWVAYDSRRVGIREYQTQLALPPLSLAVATVVVWPIMFPLYLRTRHRVISGQLARGQLRQQVWPWVLGVASVLLVVVSISWWTSRDARRELLPLAQAIATEFSTSVNLSIQDGWRGTITLPASAAAGEDRRNHAFRVAQFVNQHHVRELTSIVIKYVDVQKRGAATITRDLDTFEWSYADLRRGQPAADSTRVGTPTE